MQLGILSNIHKHHAQKELQLRNASYDPKDGIRALSVKIKLSECPGGGDIGGRYERGTKTAFTNVPNFF